MEPKKIPEVIAERKTENETVFLRTVVKKDVHERLRNFAQRYSTGQGHWDFGVAVEILLDYHDESKLGKQNEKLDFILNTLVPEDVLEKKEDEPKYMELLGGFKEKI